LILKVLLDSNIYRHDLSLEGSWFRLLFAQAEQGRFVLVLPEVVARETSDLYRRELNKSVRELRKTGRRLRSLRVDVAELEPVNVEAKTAEFREYLESKVKAAGGELAGFPDVSHGSLVDKAIARRRPFGGSGSGYRDALIWESAKAHATADEIVALASANHKDFAVADGKGLHADLTAELRDAGLDQNSVQLYRDLESFLKAVVPVEEAALHQVTELLKEDSQLAQLEDKLATALSNYPLPDEGRGFFAELGISSEGAWIEILNEVESVDARSAYALGDGNVSVELDVKASATIDFLAYKGDLYSAERMYDLGDEIDPPFHIYDYDHNESMAAAEAPMDLSLTVQAALRTESSELDDVEITDIDRA
jgi:PIN domain